MSDPAAELAASIDKLAAHLNGQGPQLTRAEVRDTHRKLDQVQRQGITAAEVRAHRRA